MLEENLVSKDPFDVFDIWFKNVASKSDISFEEINAVCFSTSRFCFVWFGLIVSIKRKKNYEIIE